MITGGEGINYENYENYVNSFIFTTEFSEHVEITAGDYGTNFIS